MDEENRFFLYSFIFTFSIHTNTIVVEIKFVFNISSHMRKKCAVTTGEFKFKRLPCSRRNERLKCLSGEARESCSSLFAAGDETADENIGR